MAKKVESHGQRGGITAETVTGVSQTNASATKDDDKPTRNTGHARRWIIWVSLTTAILAFLAAVLDVFGGA